MATNYGSFSPQSFNEIYGVVVGLFGDPANQVTASGGTDMGVAYALIGWDNKNDNFLGTLFWSRVLLVEIFHPYDNYKFSRLVFVMKPRSLWLYDKGTPNVADFVGNTVSANFVGQVDHNEIVEISPPYRVGDVIQIGSLPAPIEIIDFSDNFTRTMSPHETYDGSTTRTSTISQEITGITILGSLYNSSLYDDYATDQILYYDKNVDARSRIVGGSGSTAGTVDIKLCVGGVTSNYKLNGQRIIS